MCWRKKIFFAVLPSFIFKKRLMKFSDLLLFSQEYILKGVVNAALGQEIGSVSISITLKELHWNKCDNSECETANANVCHCAFIFQRDHLKIAQQFFQLVGGSASECGTLNRTLIDLMLWRKIVRACVCMCTQFLFFFRHYSWQTVHGLLLLPLETVWRRSHISQLCQGQCCSVAGTHYMVC